MANGDFNEGTKNQKWIGSIQQNQINVSAEGSDVQWKDGQLYLGDRNIDDRDGIEIVLMSDDYQFSKCVFTKAQTKNDSPTPSLEYSITNQARLDKDLSASEERITVAYTALITDLTSKIAKLESIISNLDVDYTKDSHFQRLNGVFTKSHAAGTLFKIYTDGRAFNIKIELNGIDVQASQKKDEAGEFIFFQIPFSIDAEALMQMNGSWVEPSDVDTVEEQISQAKKALKKAEAFVGSKDEEGNYMEDGEYHANAEDYEAEKAEVEMNIAQTEGKVTDQKQSVDDSSQAVQDYYDNTSEIDFDEKAYESLQTAEDAESAKLDSLLSSLKMDKSSLKAVSEKIAQNTAGFVTEEKVANETPDRLEILVTAKHDRDAARRDLGLEAGEAGLELRPDPDLLDNTVID